MSIEMVLITILATAFYFIIGVGFSKLAAQIKGESIDLIILITWPIGAVVFAFIGDIE